jgi:hypothetical protein
MRSLVAIAALVAVTAPLPAFAYTQQDADACTPDAFRLCQTAIPDAGRVAHCLAVNRSRLSPACRVVFSRPATAAVGTSTAIDGIRQRRMRNESNF